MLDHTANREGILRALDTIGKNVANVTGNHLALVHFSSYGALLDHVLPAVAETSG
jgi:hypothetical protein